MKAIKPAERLDTIKEYYFSIKLKEVAEMNARGENVISLGIGSPDLPPSEETINALTEDANRADAHGYQPHVGIPAFRQAFADWYNRSYGVTLDAAKDISDVRIVIAIRYEMDEALDVPEE